MLQLLEICLPKLRRFSEFSTEKFGRKFHNYETFVSWKRNLSFITMKLSSHAHDNLELFPQTDCLMLLFISIRNFPHSCRISAGG